MTIPASPDDQPNITLTGFMGAGKTTIGTRVAALLKRPFVDTDVEIVQRAGKPIARMFAEDGEAVFRQWERTLADELSGRRGLVIATGGGMLINPDNLRLLESSGIVICIDTPLDVLEKRLRHAPDRPLSGEWRDLYHRREAEYAKIKLHVHSKHKSADDLAKEIIELWQNASR